MIVAKTYDLQKLIKNNEKRLYFLQSHPEVSDIYKRHIADYFAMNDNVSYSGLTVLEKILEKYKDLQ